MTYVLNQPTLVTSNLSIRQEKKSFSVSASIMNQTQTPVQTKTHIHVSPEQIEDRLYQQSLKSGYPLSIVEERFFDFLHKHWTSQALLYADKHWTSKK